MYRKTIYCFLFMLFFNKITSEAQDFKGKIILGVTANQVDGDHYSGYNKLGFKAGGAVEYNINEKFSIQPEIYYVKKGARPTDNLFVWTINYIEFPLLVNLRFSPKFLVQAGPAANFLLSSNVSGSDVTDELNFVNPLLVAGLEYEIIPGLAINGRFAYSIVPFNKDSQVVNRGGIGGMSYQGTYNNSLYLSLRYQLNKK